MTERLATRASPAAPPPLVVSTQRIAPDSTRSAGHAAVTWLSRPEKPPIA